MIRAFVALGSNLGDREAHLGYAFAALAALPETACCECSPIYESVAVGPGPQGHYLNAVVELETGLPPRVLLRALLEIETQRGRVRGERFAARTLDLDLLVYGALEFDDPELTLPHPRLSERGFVMVPLAAIAPGLVVAGKRADLVAEKLNDPNCLWIYEKSTLI